MFFTTHNIFLFTLGGSIGGGGGGSSYTSGGVTSFTVLSSFGSGSATITFEIAPSVEPTTAPTQNPTTEPSTFMPSIEPTVEPTITPTLVPTAEPRFVEVKICTLVNILFSHFLFLLSEAIFVGSQNNCIY